MRILLNTKTNEIVEVVNFPSRAPAGQAEGAKTDPVREEFNRRVVDLLADFLTRLAEVEAEFEAKGEGRRKR